MSLWVNIWHRLPNRIISNISLSLSLKGLYLYTRALNVCPEYFHVKVVFVCVGNWKKAKYTRLFMSKSSSFAKKSNWKTGSNYFQCDKFLMACPAPLWNFCTKRLLNSNDGSNGCKYCWDNLGWQVDFFFRAQLHTHKTVLLLHENATIKY